MARRAAAVMTLTLAAAAAGAGSPQVIVIDGNGQAVQHDIFRIDVARIRPGAVTGGTDPNQAGVVVNPAELESVVIDPGVAALVDALDAVEYHRREAVKIELMRRPDDLLQLLAMLERSELTAEQRYRLVEIVRHHILTAPRGAMGISMMWRLDPRSGHGEVEVVRLLEGLPARDLLRIGDRIRLIDGRPLTSESDLKAKVQRKRPGDKVRLTVRRLRVDAQGEFVREDDELMYEVIEVDLPLGSAERLMAMEPGFNALRADPLLADRVSQAEQLRIRCSPQPTVIGVPAPPFGPLLPAPTAEALDVDHDPIIQSILAERQAAEMGAARISAQQRAVWQERLAALRGYANDPRLEPGERARRHRIVRRYAELAGQ